MLDNKFGRQKNKVETIKILKKNKSFLEFLLIYYTPNEVIYTDMFT